MLRRLLLVLVLAAVAVTAAATSYAVLTLPEPGDVQRPAWSFIEWAEENARSTETLNTECDAVNDTDESRQACFVSQLEEAQGEWRASRFGSDDLWTASEVTAKRNSYLGVGALVLLALALGLLAFRVMSQPRRVTA